MLRARFRSWKVVLAGMDMVRVIIGLVTSRRFTRKMKLSGWGPFEGELMLLVAIVSSQVINTRVASVVRAASARQDLGICLLIRERSCMLINYKGRNRSGRFSM